MKLSLKLKRLKKHWENKGYKQGCKDQHKKDRVEYSTSTANLRNSNIKIRNDYATHIADLHNDYRRQLKEKEKEKEKAIEQSVKEYKGKKARIKSSFRKKLKNIQNHKRRLKEKEKILIAEYKKAEEILSKLNQLYRNTKVSRQDLLNHCGFYQAAEDECAKQLYDVRRRISTFTLHKKLNGGK